jgi:hypothetical protein
MNFWKRLHEDEEGLETLQVVLIVGVAALILAFVKINWYRIKNFVVIALGPLFDW